MCSAEIEASHVPFELRNIAPRLTSACSVDEEQGPRTVPYSGELVVSATVLCTQVVQACETGDRQAQSRGA